MSKPCGDNAYCTDTPDSFTCTCEKGCFGDPLRGCVCVGNQCDRLQCGVNAECRVKDDDDDDDDYDDDDDGSNGAECYCPPAFPIGNPNIRCEFLLFLVRCSL